MPQKHEILGPLPITVSGTPHLKLQMLSRDSETPLEALRLQLQRKAWLAVSFLEEPRFWDNTSHGLDGLNHTVITVLLTQSTNSKGDLAQEEAVTKVSATKSCSRSCAHLTSVASLVSRREDLPLATLLLPRSMFPPSCSTSANAQQSFC